MIPDLQSAEEFDPLRELDFDFDEASAILPSPNPGHFIDRKPSSMDHAGRLAPERDSYVPLHTPLPFRPQRTCVKSDRSAPVISGSELLHLEGRPARQSRSTVTLPTANPVSSNLPTLKRRDKFYGGPSSSIRGPTEHLSRAASDDVIPSVSQIQFAKRPSPAFEMTQQRLEQISLQTSMADRPSQGYHFQNFHRQPSRWTQDDVSPRTIYAHRKAWSENAGLGSEHQPILGYYHDQSQSLSQEEHSHNSLSNPDSDQHYDTGLQPHGSFHNNPSRHVRQNAAWGGMLDFGQEFGVSPSQINPEWLHDISENGDTYYHQSMSYPTPNSQCPSAILTQGELSNNGTQSSHLNGLPSLDLSSFQSPAEAGSSQVPQPPHTPPPSSPSASPGSPEPPTMPQQQAGPQNHSPQKQSRANRKRQGALRLPKSAAALRSAKSHSNLKPTKSTGNLKSRKSAGSFGSSGGGGGSNGTGSGVSGSGGHGIGRSPIKRESSYQQPQQQIQMVPQNMFMNFTPNDKEKILTGVAPSGSSKTKARREQEEREQKRRMSLAAKREIERLGGALPAELMGIDLA